MCGLLGWIPLSKNVGWIVHHPRFRQCDVVSTHWMPHVSAFPIAGHAPLKHICPSILISASHQAQCTDGDDIRHRSRRSLKVNQFTAEFASHARSCGQVLPREFDCVIVICRSLSDETRAGRLTVVLQLRFRWQPYINAAYLLIVECTRRPFWACACHCKHKLPCLR